jgi:hypothetical protein
MEYHFFPFGNLESSTFNLDKCPQFPNPKSLRKNMVGQMVVDYQWLQGTQCSLRNS